MTPRHLCMFCLGQLASIGAGMILARIVRKIYLHSDQLGNLPGQVRLLADDGWGLIVIPILCVLLVPRHREDESEPANGFSKPAAIALGLGLLALLYPFSTGLFALFHLWGVKA